MINNITLKEQSSIKINYNNQNIYFDPYLLHNEYNHDADYIFISHNHYDHYSEEDILSIKNNNTKIIIPYDLEEKVYNLGFSKNNIILVKPNNTYKIDNISFETVRAYNINKNYHKLEYNWVGYIINLDQIIYFAGDTDNVPEIRNIKCDIACVPIGGVYTMDVKESVELIKCIKPKIVIPMHYKTIVGTVKDAYEFKRLLEGITDVEIIME